MIYAYVLVVKIMRTTINIDDSLLDSASRLTGITEKTALVRSGLEALIALESAKRLADLGGSEPNISAIPRRRAEIPLDKVAEDSSSYSKTTK